MNLAAPLRFEHVAEPATPQQKYLALDLLRGAAALTVFFCHVRAAAFVEFGALPASQQTLPVATVFALTRIGHEAVLVFFILSGFLVGGPAIRRALHQQFDLRTYAIDRGTRIFVPLIPACILTVAVGSFAFNVKPDWLRVGLNIVGLNNIFGVTLPINAPLWSLAYEVWFYVFAGAAAYMLSNRRIDAAALVALLGAFAILSCSRAGYLLFWCLGAATTFALPWHNKNSLAMAGLVCFLTGCATYEASAASRSFANIALVPMWASETLVSVGVCLTLPLLCTQKAGDALKPIRASVLGLSRMSYSLYLVHYPLNCTLDLWLPRATELSLASFAAFFMRGSLVFGGSLLFYLCFESQTATIRRFLARRSGNERGNAPC
ncbi:acyltransferase 3 [Hyphomicrobium denitrificans 1NES1]|uniref:Acyltransferase 3 n=1 Tax=Hyphomicrobium denitrificans 1NES1 TaxID=670307 RepID=N0B345_9HYPH|nr:acyltransferase [Hyphomicrobium denitrificans]AGK56622.1 acyltransferase 3 [Hyphomicrobium denitrificans 1NES1]